MKLYNRWHLGMYGYAGCRRMWVYICKRRVVLQLTNGPEITEALGILQCVKDTIARESRFSQQTTRSEQVREFNNSRIQLTDKCTIGLISHIREVALPHSATNDGSKRPRHSGRVENGRLFYEQRFLRTESQHPMSMMTRLRGKPEWLLSTSSTRLA